MSILKITASVECSLTWNSIEWPLKLKKIVKNIPVK